MSRLASLKEASRALGLSEDALRRRILLGELEATPVDDDRQYLVAVPASARPRCCGRFRLYLWCLAAWAVVAATVLFGTSTTQERCGRCASVRVTERLLGVPAETLIVERGAACGHEWRVTGRRSFRPSLRESWRDVPE